MGLLRARALMALMAALALGCGAGNQGLYEPSYGGGAPQCGIADMRPAPPPTPAWNPPSARPHGAPSASVALEPWQQHARASQMIARIAQAGATVGRLLEQARAQKDVVETLCMNDKLAQIDVALRSAIERKVTLGEAAERGDAAVSTHEFTVLTVLNQRVDQLSAEANQCLGEEIASASETVVTTHVSGSSREMRAPKKPDVARDESVRRGPPSPPPPPSPAPIARAQSDMVRSVPGVSRHGGAAGAQGGRPPAQVARPPVLSPGPATGSTLPPPPPPKQAPASVLTTDAPHDTSLMVYTADVGLAVRHIGKGLDAIESIARDSGGFLSQRADREITILVPRERFIETIERITKLGDVRKRSIAALDVTDEFVDLEVRLTNARPAGAAHRPARRGEDRPRSARGRGRARADPRRDRSHGVEAEAPQ